MSNEIVSNTFEKLLSCLNPDIQVFIKEADHFTEQPFYELMQFPAYGNGTAFTEHAMKLLLGRSFDPNSSASKEEQFITWLKEGEKFVRFGFEGEALPIQTNNEISGTFVIHDSKDPTQLFATTTCVFGSDTRSCLTEVNITPNGYKLGMSRTFGTDNQLEYEKDWDGFGCSTLSGLARMIGTMLSFGIRDLIPIGDLQQF